MFFCVLLFFNCRICLDIAVIHLYIFSVPPYIYSDLEWWLLSQYLMNKEVNLYELKEIKLFISGVWGKLENML